MSLETEIRSFQKAVDRFNRGTNSWLRYGTYALLALIALLVVNVIASALSSQFALAMIVGGGVVAAGAHLARANKIRTYALALAFAGLSIAVLAAATGVLLSVFKGVFILAFLVAVGFTLLGATRQLAK